MRVGDPRLRSLVGVQQRSAGCHRLHGIEHGGQRLVLDRHRGGRELRLAGGVGDHGGDALAGEPDHGVEQPGVVGVVLGMLVASARVELVRRVVGGQHEADALHPESARGVDAPDAGVGVRRADEPHVQHPREVGIERERLGAGDDPAGRG
jgi:hypothetical protein